MNPPTVSIIVPAYNSAQTIRACLDSVAAQTFGDHETIVVDDGSSDETVAILRADYPDCRVFVQEVNGGPAAARNRGIGEARGEWLAFLDADDVWRPRRLDLQMRQATAHPEAGMFCGNTTTIRAGTEQGENMTAEPADEEVFELGDESTREIGLQELAEHNPIATSTVLVKRSVVNAVGGFDEQFRGPEDYDLWIRIAARDRILYMDVPLAGYRYRLGSLSMDDRTFLPEVLSVLDKAYARGGGLHGSRGRNRTKAYHYLACSWMAAERGDLSHALRLFGRSLLLWPFPYRGRFQKLPGARTKLLVYFAKAAAAKRDR